MKSIRPWTDLTKISPQAKATKAAKLSAVFSQRMGLSRFPWGDQAASGDCWTVLDVGSNSAEAGPERAIVDRAPNLQQQVGVTSRPPNLLCLVHPSRSGRLEVGTTRTRVTVVHVWVWLLASRKVLVYPQPPVLSGFPRTSPRGSNRQLIWNV
jgi:hypothetical protein